jgi:hypothetical protein
LPDKISEHNYRAVGGRNPERSARVKSNRLRNKCKEAILSCGIQGAEFVNWSDDIETSTAYIDALNYVRQLYEVNSQFQKDVQESTQISLVSLKNGREKTVLESGENAAVVSDIYESCEKFVLVYHRPMPLFEKYFDGGYDSISRTSLGLYVLK